MHYGTTSAKQAVNGWVNKTTPSNIQDGILPQMRTCKKYAKGYSHDVYLYNDGHIVQNIKLRKFRRLFIQPPISGSVPSASCIDIC